MDDFSFGTGALPSKRDIRTFRTAHDDTKATSYRQSGGERYVPEDIENQHRIGLCTAISLTQQARKATGIPYSADFQYLMQKELEDKNWNEGSSAFSALRVAKNVGFLPAKEWTYTTESDRRLSYRAYIEKIQSVPAAEIARMKTIAAKYKLLAYARITDLSRDSLAEKIDESDAGIIARFVINRNWIKKPIEPLRPPEDLSNVTGHLVTISNYDGGSMRIANTWGSLWADGGTAYFLLKNYQPTEAWIPYYNNVPDDIQQQLDLRLTLLGRLKDLLQQMVEMLQRRKSG